MQLVYIKIVEDTNMGIYIKNDCLKFRSNTLIIALTSLNAVCFEQLDISRMYLKRGD